jgi:hypothetical protein
MAGQQVACPHCGTPITVPGQQSLAAPPTDAQEADNREEVTDAAALLPPGAGSLAVAPPDPAAPVETRAKPWPSYQSERGGDAFPPSLEDSLPPGMTGSQPPLALHGPNARQQADERSPPSPPRSYPRRTAADDLLPPTPPVKSSPKRRDRDDLLPPGLAATAESPAAEPVTPASPTFVPAAHPAERIDDLLPPGAATAGPTRSEQATSSAAVDSMLPSGVAASTPTAVGVQVAIPNAPQRLPGQHRNLPAGAIVVPTPEGGFVTVTETPKTIGEGDEEIELRRLTSEEKAKRRFLKNLLLGGFCLALIVIVVAILLW